jgi:hypothetical protein
MTGCASPRPSRWLPLLGLALVFAAGGCGGGPRTHSLEGKVVVEGGDTANLGDSAVEAQLDGNPAVRASGQIEPDGSFSLSTLHEGRTLSGAPEGTYSLRLVLTDFEYEEPEEDPADEGEAPAYRPKPRNAPKPPVPVKYLSFKTSGWKTTVPADGPVTLTVSNAKKR